MNNIEMISDKHIGDFYALRGSNSKKAFKNPMRSCLLVKLHPDDVVVDLGAYIGEYSMMAARVCKNVIAYEASPETFKVLKMNKRPNMTIYNKAVVGDSSKKVELFLSSGIGATNSKVKTKSKSVIVPAINYLKAIEGATVVKIDVEGAEYSYDLIQPHLRAIILEFHPLTNTDWKQKANQIITNLKRAGFKPLMVPQFKNGWDTNSAWVRNNRSKHGN